MSTTERDSTGDWILPPEARPATMLELEQRVDVALAVARSAEATAVEIGAAAFDAAEQARRAAEFAERAVTGKASPSSVAADAEPEVAEAIAAPVISEEAEMPALPRNGFQPAPRRGGNADSDERLRLFSERADRVMVRLRALEPVA